MLIKEADAILRKKCGISFNTVRNNITRKYEIANDEELRIGREWYSIAKLEAQIIAATYGITQHQSIAIMAQLSPRTRWNKNVAGTIDLLENGWPMGHIPQNVFRAIDSANSIDPLNDPNGKKVNAFAQNINGNPIPVTIDVWAMRTAMNNAPGNYERMIDLVGVYGAIQLAFQSVANKQNELPSSLQAIVWVVERGNAF